MTVFSSMKNYSICVFPQLTGGTLLVSGLLLLQQSGFLNNDVIALLNDVTVNAIKLGVVLMFLAFGMTVCGGVTMVTAIVGGVAATRRSRPFLLMVSQSKFVTVYIFIHGRLFLQLI